MNIARGYQANCVLEDGSVFTLGGSWSGGVGNKHGEVWTEAAGWKRLTGVPITPMLSNDPSRNFGGDSHFWLFPAPNGRVFHAGPGVNMHWIGTQGDGSVSVIGPRGDDEFSVNGNAVMYDIGKILKTGGGPAYEGVNANANSYVIDINDGVQVRKIAPNGLRARVPQQRGAAQRPGRDHRRPDLCERVHRQQRRAQARVVRPGDRDLHARCRPLPWVATTTAWPCCCPMRASCRQAAGFAVRAVLPTILTCRS